MNDIREEKAVFVGIIRQGDSERKVKEYLDELEFLANTAGAKGDRKFVQKLDKPEKATYIRSGKLQEIAQYCEENEIKYVIFDDELSGMQQRNIEKVIKTSSRDILAEGADRVREDAGGAREIQLHAPPARRNVDPPRKAERRYRNARRNG